MPPMHANRSVISSRANVGFIPAIKIAPDGLAGCNVVVPWQATSPLFQSPPGAPFGPSATTRCGSACLFAPPFGMECPNSFACLIAYYALCRPLPFVQLGSRLAQLAWVNSLAPTARQISRGKTQNCPCVSAGFIKHAPLGRWRTSLSRANSSRACHTSDPVRVPRPALSDWASFRPHLTMTPLPFS